VLLSGAVVAVIQWSRGRAFSRQNALRLGTIVVLLNLIGIPNNWKTAVSDFSTAQPYALQAGMHIASTLISAILIAVMLALAGGLVAASNERLRRPVRGMVFAGVTAGVFVAAIRALAALVVP